MALTRKRRAALELGPLEVRRAFQERIASASKRRMGRYVVHFPADGKAPFVLVKRVDGRVRTRPGEIRTCAKCGAEYFWQQGARADQQHCSRACGNGLAMKKKRQGILAKGGPKKDALDRIFSVMVRSAGACAACGSTERLQCAHIVSRRYLSVRYAFENAMCLCAGCHMKFTHRPLEWEVFVIERMGEAAYRDLKRRALSANGPLDRKATADYLYAEIERRGLTLGASVPGWSGWTGLKDDTSWKH